MEIEKISGRFKLFIYEGDNHFKIGKFKLEKDEHKTITVTGYLQNIEEDFMYTLYGKYVQHPKYGMQFEIFEYEVCSGDDEDSVIRFFASSMFPKIGKKSATCIVQQLGIHAFDILKEDPTIIHQIYGLNDRQRAGLQEGIDACVEKDETILFLAYNGVSNKNIQMIKATYKERALEVVKSNPYKLVLEIDGIGFKTVDKLAMKLGFDITHPNRLMAMILHSISQYGMSTGNTFIEFNVLQDIFQRNFPAIDEETFLLYFETLKQQGSLVLEGTSVYLETLYDAEKEIAQYLYMMNLKSQEIIKEEDILSFIMDLEIKDSIAYEEKQSQAICDALTHPFNIITGGPGTGKTTIVKAILEAIEHFMPTSNIQLCAPTGRAAKRLSALSGYSAMTIHSMLKWDLHTNTFHVNAQEPLNCDVLIIDEFSMVDTLLFHNILSACIRVNKIIVIGDEDQLPSVGPGFVLKDLICSGQFSLSRLEKIFRQEEGNDIVELACEMRQGACTSIHHANDVKFIPAQNYQICNAITQIVQNAMDKGYNAYDMQVLAPMYDGVAGIDALNIALQKVCNPKMEGKRELQLGYRILREKDKILQLKNQPDDDVYNGDIGEIVEIIYKDEDFEHKDRIICRFESQYVEYTSENFSVITHAYCISIHKAQGSEYPIVILPVVKDYTYMLQRRLIYTAITRAKKSLILLGHEDALINGINSQERDVRNTKLTQRILSVFE